MMSAPTDPRDDLPVVLDAARRGDVAARDELYRRFARAVHGIALAQVGREEAEDVTQEAFAAVFRGLPTVLDPAAFPGWVCQVARHAALDHLRRRARRRRAEPLREEPPAAAGKRSDEELRGRILARLRELPETYRETLVLRLVEGLTGPEIAARTGLAPGSVRVNLCRGMALLRPLLREEGWP